jgi:hypothetical protein
MMIAVAAVACIAAVATAVLRRDRLETAEYHRDLAAMYLRMSQDEEHTADMIEGKVPNPVRAFLVPDNNVAGHRSNARAYGERAKYHMVLRSKYEFAADRPLSPVEPDPSPP